MTAKQFVPSVTGVDFTVGVVITVWPEKLFGHWKPSGFTVPFER